MRGVRLDKLLGRDVPDVAALGHGEWKRESGWGMNQEKGRKLIAAAAEGKKEGVSERESKAREASSFFFHFFFRLFLRG